MKHILGDFLTAFAVGFALPSLLMGITVCCYEQQEKPQPEETHAAVWEEPQIRYTVRQRTGEVVQERDLDGYLVGVVLAEMPASFEKEALKAQAVAARTYACRAYLTGGKHADGSVCTDSSCCQSYISPEEYIRSGGNREDLEKVQLAVESTSGLVLTYEGELIEATYFSSSGGRTEDAVEVWGAEYPYLQSVESPGEENAAHYRQTRIFTPEEFAGKLGYTPEGEVQHWCSLTEYTQGGSVKQMVIGEETFTGTQLRSLLGLRSAAFSLEVVDGQIEITTKGYGHRVGMSQYGAQAMALQGCSYADILSHYYTGAELAWMGVE